MIEYKELPNTNIIEAVVDGKVDADEYHALAKKALAFMEQHKKIRVIKIIKSFDGFDLDILKEKLIMDLLKHKHKISHTALVTDEGWIEQLAEFITPMFPYRTRCYKLSDIEAARAWVHEAKDYSAQVTDDSTGNLISIQVTDKLTHEDYEEVLIPALEAAIKEHGKARLIVDFGEHYKGFDLSAMWDDTKFGIKHRADFEKLAIVGGPSWSNWAAKLGEAMMHCEVQSFGNQEYQKALDWLKQPAKTPA